ncbi:MAG: recombinase family protein, partial [Myxococcaceae bacterium]
YVQPMNIGYCRVSTQDQNLELQLDELKKAGCEKIFQDVASGSKDERQGLLEAVSFAREGDCIVVWKLDRLSRSLKDLLHIMDKVHAAGAGFKSVTEAIDTTTAAGRMMMQMVGSFAEFERAMVRERTLSGLKQARSEGRIGGRPPKLTNTQNSEIIEMVSSGRKTAAEAARIFGVHRATVGRLVAQN